VSSFGSPSQLVDAELSSSPVMGDRALGDIEAEIQELAVDSWGAPGGILAGHPPDESPDFGTDLRPAKALRP
jgi:hypothetical protein